MKTLLTWLTTLVMLAASWFLLSYAPDNEDAEAPFVVNAALGELANGRNIAVTVEKATRANRATGTSAISSSYLWSAEGHWIIIDLAAETRESSLTGAIRLAQLDIDGRSYRTSERVSGLFGTPLANGLPRKGSLAFELPADASGSATLTVGLSQDARLDSVIEYTFDLDDLPRMNEAEVKVASW